MKINAVHSFTVSPFFTKPHNKFTMNDFEVMTMIMSALAWRRYNGSIKLYTDSYFAEWIYENNLEFLWDNGIDLHLFENAKKNINKEIFWAATKLDVIENMKVQEAHIDIDFIMWKSINEQVAEGDVVGSHFEDTGGEFTCYINKEKMMPPENYIFPTKLDWSFPAINTSFIYFNSKDAKDLFCKECVRYMENNNNKVYDDSGKDDVQMVFAEQRLTSMFLKFKNFDIRTITNYAECKNETTGFTHLGGLKGALKRDHIAEESYTIACVSKIKQDFSDFLEQISKVKCLKKYF